MARARAIDTRLEKLIPSTDELFVTGIMSKEEIQQLVKDRTFHEYKLVARPLLLIDVKNAINFELALEKRIAAFCAEYNRQAAQEASGRDEEGRKKRSGAPVKKLQLKHRWAVQERIESIYRIGLKHLFTQRKTASLLQLKRKCTLTTAPLTSGASASHGASIDAPLDDYEVIRRECVSQLKAFNRNVSLSKLYAEWLTRSPQDAFLWSEAALFEAQSGRNDEARAIIQQALATLRQTSSLTKTSDSAKATAATSVKVARKEFVRQKATEESKEVWGTALLIEILFAKKLLEGAIEAAVRNDDTNPVANIRKENSALASVVFDLALAETIVADAAQPSAEGQLPFLCPDLGLHLYSVAVCHQFTAGLCRKILLTSLATASSQGHGSATPSQNTVASNSPLTSLFTELFLSEVRFTATNCVSAERFATEKAMADLALVKADPNRGVEVQREWVVKHLNRKHRVVTVEEKKRRVVSSIGAAVTLLLTLQAAERTVRTTIGATDNNNKDESQESLFGALLRTITSGASASVSTSLAALRLSLSDAIIELLSLSKDLVPIHISDAQDAISALETAIAEAKNEKSHSAAKKSQKNKKRDRDETKEASQEQDEALVADSDALVSATANKIFLFSQTECSHILRIVLLLQSLRTTNSKVLSIHTILQGATDEINKTPANNKKKNSKSATATTGVAVDEATASFELYNELCAAAGLLSSQSIANGDKKDDQKSRRTVVQVCADGTRLLKSFINVAFSDSTISLNNSDIAAASDAFEETNDEENAFFEDATAGTAVLNSPSKLSREQLWWDGIEGNVSLLDTKFLSVRMLPEDLVTVLGVAQSQEAFSVPTSPKKAQPAAITASNITSREDVETQVSRLLALIDNEDALHHENLSTATNTAVVVPMQQKGKNVTKTAVAPTPQETAADPVVTKLASAIQLLVCTTNLHGAYPPYNPSTWRLFAALLHTLSMKMQKLKADEISASNAQPVGTKTAREGKDIDSSDEDEEDNEGRNAPKKKIRIGTVAATSTSIPASTSSAAAAPSVIAQRSDLDTLLSEIKDGKIAPTFTALQSFSRRLFLIGLQIISGGSSHASLPTYDLRVERIRGILALTIVELNRELALGIGASALADAKTHSRISFNSPAIFLAAQVLQFYSLVDLLGAKGQKEMPSIPSRQIQSLFAQLLRLHNQLLPPVRIADFSATIGASAGYCTPIPRVMLKHILIPVFAATHAAAQRCSPAESMTSAKTVVSAAEKVLRSLVSQLTSLYTVEVREAGKFGNGIRSSSQYSVVQKKDVSDYILQNRPEVFLPYFFPTASGGALPSSSNGSNDASLTKAYISNAQVSDWLLVVALEQKVTKDLKAAHDAHQRAIRTVECPQVLLATSELPSLY